MTNLTVKNNLIGTLALATIVIGMIRGTSSYSSMRYHQSAAAQIAQAFPAVERVSDLEQTIGGEHHISESKAEKFPPGRSAYGCDTMTPESLPYSELALPRDEYCENIRERTVLLEDPVTAAEYRKMRHHGDCATIFAALGRGARMAMVFGGMLVGAYAMKRTNSF